MKIDMSEIIVEEAVRIRKDVGDLDTLQSSIAKVGLINPVLIDENNTLIAGFRRLTACQNLGWKEIEVSVLTLSGDKIKMLDVEIAENFFRKDFTPDEILATEKRRQDIMEEQREIGFWEKFWVWLKSFFLPQPQESGQQATGDEKKSQPQADEDAETVTAAEETVLEEAVPEEAVPEEAPPVAESETSESVIETDDPAGEEKIEKVEKPKTKPE